MGLLRNKRGFTLIEVLIVLIILGVLAAAAFPVYTAQVRRSYRAEALTQIATIRGAMADFFTMNNTYAGAAFGAPLSAAAIGYTDPGVAANIGQQTPHFAYTLGALTATTYTVTATSVASPFLAAGLTVIFNQAGAEGASTLP